MSFIRLSIFCTVVLVVLSCHTALTAIKNKNEPHVLDAKYRVTKIDTVNDYYFVYAKKQDTLYKIVSKNEGVGEECNEIVIGKEYRFELESIWRKNIKINGVNVSPSGIPHVNCLSLDERTDVCLERDSINDIFKSNNLKGLCIKGSSIN